MRHHLVRILEAIWLLVVMGAAIALVDRDGHVGGTDLLLALPIIAVIALAHRTATWLARRRRA